MRVFISWSGERSKQAALCLREWLQDVMQGVEVWMSPDILAGERWFEVVLKELGASHYCVACLTPENFRSPWVLFEAGAIANCPGGKGFACAYLIDITVDELERHPLSHFQMARADENGTWELVKSINEARGDARLDQHRLEKAFKKWWKDLDGVLQVLPNPDFRGHPSDGPAAPKCDWAAVKLGHVGIELSIMPREPLFAE